MISVRNSIDYMQALKQISSHLVRRYRSLVLRYILSTSLQPLWRFAASWIPIGNDSEDNDNHGKWEEVKSIGPCRIGKTREKANETNNEHRRDHNERNIVDSLK